MATTAPRTKKFARRREQLLDLASRQINDQGARAMTLTAVAKQLSLDTSSVTYYFKRKDDLVGACLARTMHWLHESARMAAEEPSPRHRVRRFVHEHLALHRRQRDPAEPRLALLSDLPTLPEPVRSRLEAQYRDVFRIVRGFFDATTEERDHRLLCTSYLLATILWLPAWIDRYMVGDFERIEQRLCDILFDGLQVGGRWQPAIEPLEEVDRSAQGRFLLAATNLINREGYLGASVEKIAAELGVSTGSFYHHLDNKDDLVIACFQRSFALIKRAQQASAAQGGAQGEQLARTLASLLALQFAGESPLLRINAYQALPVELRLQMLHRTGQVTRHIAGTISDGMIDGSLRPIDAVLAGHAVLAAINAASDLRGWAAGRPLEEAVGGMLRLVGRGMFGEA
ncbi:TetR/AcrR family transcriptional regulator [Sphingomonas ginkgonis]|uniref:TetR/AcrR family transcriptional regulator n=1 Tax=Sphingomonas ginkgonis TaxID=2315330 RepID=A0A3R9WQP3_9SPHN|nr:TetR/AcrR family transcriptional regulator [Sphingomonas ginkgonis]RST31133.1 TetR/AcrR family transcriptional regulator [Sphingomonas ginkgonis]